MFELDENEVIRVLTRNAIKCLACNTVLESKHRHNYTQCPCSNGAATDGGLSYQRISAKDLDLIENLCEYIEITDDEYTTYQEGLKIKAALALQNRIDKGEMKFLLGQWVSQSTYDLFTTRYPEYKES